MGRSYEKFENRADERVVESLTFVFKRCDAKRKGSAVLLHSQYIFLLWILSFATYMQC